MSGKETKKTWIEREVRPFSVGRTLKEPVGDMSPSDMVTAFQLLNGLEKAIKARKLELRNTLLFLAQAKGEKSKTGSFTHTHDGAEVQAKFSKKKEPTKDKFLDLLREKKIAPKHAYDVVETLQYNPSKVQALIDKGRLDKTDVSALCSESFSLQVKASEQVEGLLEKAAALPSQSKKSKKQSSTQTEAH